MCVKYGKFKNSEVYLKILHMLRLKSCFQEKGVFTSSKHLKVRSLLRDHKIRFCMCIFGGGKKGCIVIKDYERDLGALSF